jgi:hypothetical protein
LRNDVTARVAALEPTTTAASTTPCVAIGTMPRAAARPRRYVRRALTAARGAARRRPFLVRFLAMLFPSPVVDARRRTAGRVVAAALRRGFGLLLRERRRRIFAPHAFASALPARILRAFVRAIISPL